MEFKENARCSEWSRPTRRTLVVDYRAGPETEQAARFELMFADSLTYWST
jgi:hypothetical protein